ncbi:phosphopantetheine-binding protein [Nonomuraea sp. NPDC050556]|uniref:phosphopantetheine-binding protein n=1 Tax=Nonomuraea sp. NPDC050556 TaxID=3364369 RepID=UPI00378F13A5
MIAPSTSLPELGLDSLATVALLIALEQELDIMIPDERLGTDSFSTAGSLWAMISDLEEAKWAQA